VVDDQRCQGDQATGDTARLKVGKIALYEALAPAPARHSHSDPGGFVGRQSSRRRSTIVTRVPHSSVLRCEYARSHVVYVCVSPTTQNSRLAGDRAQNEDFVLVSQGAGHQRTQVPLPPVPCNRVGKGHRPV